MAQGVGCDGGKTLVPNGLPDLTIGLNQLNDPAGQVVFTFRPSGGRTVCYIGRADALDLTRNIVFGIFTYPVAVKPDALRSHWPPQDIIVGALAPSASDLLFHPINGTVWAPNAVTTITWSFPGPGAGAIAALIFPAKCVIANLGNNAIDVFDFGDLAKFVALQHLLSDVA